MPISYAPESMKLANSVLDVQEYLPQHRVYLPVDHNIEITRAAQSLLAKEAPAPTVWYMDEGGRAVENDLLLFLKSTVRIRATGPTRLQLQSASADPDSSWRKPCTSADAMRKSQPLQVKGLNDIYERITQAPRPGTAHPGKTQGRQGAAVKDTKTPGCMGPSRPTAAARAAAHTVTITRPVQTAKTQRPRLYSARVHGYDDTCNIVRPCTLPSSPRAATRQRATVSLAENDITVSELMTSSNVLETSTVDAAAPPDTRPITDDKLTLVCGALNLTTTQLPRRCNMSLVKSKSETSHVLMSVLKNSRAYAASAKDPEGAAINVVG